MTSKSSDLIKRRRRNRSRDNIDNKLLIHRCRGGGLDLKRCSISSGGEGGGGDQIPHELITDILNRLPLKSLCRFKCVSKSWRSLIIDNFLRSRRRPIVGYLPLPNTSAVCFYSIDGSTGIANHMSTSPSLGRQVDSFKVCNGLLCFVDHGRPNTMGVYNPTTQEKLRVPKTSKTINNHPELFDFGFDPLSKKYKVLDWSNYPHCAIFTLGTKSWRPITTTPPADGRGRPYSYSICMAGTFYWYSSTSMIVSFDLANECFGAFQGPQIGHESHPDLFELEGCLCLVDHRVDDTMDLWMLKDHKDNINNNKGWVLMASVTLPSSAPFISWISWQFPYSTRAGEIVLAGTEEKDNRPTLHLHSFLTQQFDSIKIFGLASNFIVTDYAENFVSLKDLYL